MWGLFPTSQYFSDIFHNFQSTILGLESLEGHAFPKFSPIGQIEVWLRVNSSFILEGGLRAPVIGLLGRIGSFQQPIQGHISNLILWSY